jgi:hypothetical protein
MKSELDKNINYSNLDILFTALNGKIQKFKILKN